MIRELSKLLVDHRAALLRVDRTWPHEKQVHVRKMFQRCFCYFRSFWSRCLFKSSFYHLVSTSFWWGKRGRGIMIDSWTLVGGCRAGSYDTRTNTCTLMRYQSLRNAGVIINTWTCRYSFNLCCGWMLDMTSATTFIYTWHSGVQAFNTPSVYLCFSLGAPVHQLPDHDSDGGTSSTREDLHLQKAHQIPELDRRYNERYHSTAHG